MSTETSTETRDFTLHVRENGVPITVLLPLTYTVWMQYVDRRVQAISGLSQSDLPDWNSWDAWNAGLLPVDAARECLEGADFPFED